MDRGTLAHLAAATGGTARFLADGDWADAETAALATAFPDRSRHEYETGGADLGFKRRLNAALLAAAAGSLCLEWILRRLARLA